jgi:hypothetical protein
VLHVSTIWKELIVQKECTYRINVAACGTRRSIGVLKHVIAGLSRLLRLWFRIPSGEYLL